jgi:hypothetical protein
MLAAEGSAAMTNPFDELFARLAHPAPATSVPDPAPSRQTKAFAIAHPHDVSAGVVVLAEAGAPATKLVDVLSQTGGFILVRKGTDLGALPFAFDRQPPPHATPNKPWVELRLGATIELETVASKPIPVASVDKIGEAVAATGMNAVDVLVAEDTNVEQLIAVADQLRGAKVEAIGLGRAPAPDSPEATARGEHGPRLLAWDFFMQHMDKVDPGPFRAAFDAALAPIHTCYVQSLAKKPGSSGTGRVELTVTPDGKAGETTGSATALGADVSKCIVASFKKGTFPKVATPLRLGAQLVFIAGSPGSGPTR